MPWRGPAVPTPPPHSRGREFVPPVAGLLGAGAVDVDTENRGRDRVVVQVRDAAEPLTIHRQSEHEGGRRSALYPAPVTRLTTRCLVLLALSSGSNADELWLHPIWAQSDVRELWRHQ